MSESAKEIIKVLIVDDDQNLVETLKLAIQDRLDAIEVEVAVFNDGIERIRKPHSYDVLVLDWFEGEVGRGKEILDEVLREKIMPVIAYTAFAEQVRQEFPVPHPIFRCIEKGSESVEEVINHLRAIRSYVLGLRGIRKELNAAIKNVLLDVSPVIWKSENDDEYLAQLLLRSTRRRLAAMMDMDLESGDKLLVWEQYIYPPLEPTLLMGDLLRVKGGSETDPAVYRLVLTPSCDLVATGGRQAISNVLVARCEGVEAYLNATGLTIGGQISDNVKKRLVRFLNDAQYGGYIFLPEFKTVFPPLTACLKELELIPFAEIGSISEAQLKYERVVSIDSPFREQIAWAYLQIAARPGMPNRDLERCIQDNFVPSQPSTNL